MPPWRDIPQAERLQLAARVRRWLEADQPPRHALQWKEALRDLGGGSPCLGEAAFRALVAFLLGFPTAQASFCKESQKILFSRFYSHINTVQMATRQWCFNHCDPTLPAISHSVIALNSSEMSMQMHCMPITEKFEALLPVFLRMRGQCVLQEDCHIFLRIVHLFCATHQQQCMSVLSFFYCFRASRFRTFFFFVFHKG